MESRPLLTPEVHFAQLLASNEVKVRNKALKKLGRWLESRSRTANAFTETGMLQLWKGIYYYFWNLDKALIQEQMAGVISKYIHNFHKASAAFMYIDAFFQTMAREWFAIDRYRLEKFMMFVRKFLQETFIFLKKHRWTMKMVRKLRNVMKKNLASDKQNALGLKMHVVDIYMEELARIGAEDLSPEMVRALLVPYCYILAYSDNIALLKSVQKDIFLYLVTQDADPETFGQFPQLKYDLDSIENLLRKWLSKSDLKRLNKSAILKTIQQLHSFSGSVPESEEKEEEEISGIGLTKRKIDRAARSLQAMQKRLNENLDEEKISPKKRKKIV